MRSAGQERRKFISTSSDSRLSETVFGFEVGADEAYKGAIIVREEPSPCVYSYTRG